ncbi:hypothetical protein EPUL_004517 [Erysiphe pulchra]|uniref:Major facilitator superfamily (MFS) profile domain-containing protein n=1 Tax=Erysiphe pulchra TaxID=225359 RepID=A0A2S4PW01_9PEZI|nr:hypothetical protein EPUL_004517 [Erysiphe pulchra]
MTSYPANTSRSLTSLDDVEENFNEFIGSQVLTHYKSNTTKIYNRSDTTIDEEKSSTSVFENGSIKWNPPLLSNPDQYLVDFDGPNDPMNAQNWKLKKKLINAAILNFNTLVSVFTSSIFSTASSAFASEYHVSDEVGILGLSLFVLGFAFGPNIWAPLSELKGRKPVLVWSRLGFSIFQIGTATARNVQTTLICRFLGGVFGAAPIAVVSGALVDMFSNKTRGIAMVLLCMAMFIGPLIAPFIGGFITQSSFGWRWTQWLTAALGFISFFLNLFLHESYAPAILVFKAVKLRQKTHNWAIHAKHEELEINFKQLITIYLSRPIRMLLKEPILILFSIYMSFIYGISYLFLTAYPIVFEEIHGIPPGNSGLPFFGMILGIVLGGTFVILTQASYSRKLTANKNINIPEWRLPPMMVGSIIFAIGIFWFAWTGYKSSIHWIIPTLSGIPTGFGLIVIFIQSINYLVDTYLKFTASALAGSSLLRSLAGAGFPLFSGALFNTLGINWGCTILGFIAALLVLAPIIFYKYGSRIRASSSL